MGNSETKLDDDLINACKAGESNKIENLIKNGGNINCKDVNGSTPLMWSCSQGNDKCINICLKHNANLDDRDKDGYTALHWCVIQKHYNATKILIEHKSDVNAKNNQGDTPLHKAIYYGQKNIASLLITNGAHINGKNNIGETPLDKARTKDIKIFLKSLGGENNSKETNIEGIDPNDNNELKKQANLSDMDREYLELNEMKNDVKNWIKELKLPIKYYDLLINNGYDRMSVIVDCDADDFKDLGILKGHIKILLKEIKKYKETLKIKQNIELNNQPGYSNSNNNNNNNDINENNDDDNKIDINNENNNNIVNNDDNPNNNNDNNNENNNDNGLINDSNDNDIIEANEGGK